MIFAERTLDLETHRQNAQQELEIAGFTEIQVVYGEDERRIWLEGGTVCQRQDARALLRTTRHGRSDYFDFV